MTTPSQIIPINIEDEMKESYLSYSMSVIVGRALPDVRDGLKPVHRRILFSKTMKKILPKILGFILKLILLILIITMAWVTLISM